MKDAANWVTWAIATLALAVSLFQWWQMAARERRRDDRVAKLERQQQLNAYRQAVDRVVSRWRVSSLGSLTLSTDPDVPAVAASAKRWRRAAADEQALLAAAAHSGRTLPYRLIEQAAQTLRDFESVIDPIAFRLADDENRLWHDDPDWQARLSRAIEEMQTRMNSIIDQLDGVSEDAMVATDAVLDKPAGTRHAAG